MALNAYLAQVQALLHDSSAKVFTTSDLTTFINAARSQIAMESESVWLIPSGNNTVVSQQAYTFASLDAIVQATPGIQSVISVKEVSVLWGGTGGSVKPMLRRYTWQDFQALFRQYATPLLSDPQIWAQFGAGPSGAVYLYPIPVQVAPMDWNCRCRPVDLVDDSTVEILAWPWTDAVQYYAAFMAMMSVQRPEQANNYFKIYESFMKRASAMTSQDFVPDQYD